MYSREDVEPPGHAGVKSVCLGFSLPARGEDRDMMAPWKRKAPSYFGEKKSTVCVGFSAS